MTDRELMQMADRIEALAFEMKAPNAYTPQFVMLAYEIREALRARLAQPEQKQEWVGLTTAESKVLWNTTKKAGEFAKAIEAKLKEKNNG